jgi:peroxiredoxin
MKRYIMTLVGLLFFACNAIGGDEYEIKGKIQNSTAKTIYLEKLSHAEMKLIDSATISNTGDFRLASTIDGTGFYRMRIQTASAPEMSWFMSLGKGEKVVASLDESKPLTYSITGNSDQKEIQDLMKNLNSQQTEMSQLYQQYGTFGDKNKNSKEAQDLIRVIQNKTETFNNYVTSVIQQSKGIITKYYLYSVLMQQFQNQPVPDQLAQDVRNFTTTMQKSHPNSVYTKDFINILANIDMSKKQLEAKSKLEIGAMAPDVDLTTGDGKKVKLSSFKGKVVLMDFWASWCRPCRMESPNVVKAYNKYKDKGFVVLSISSDQDLEKWKTAIQQDGLIWSTHFADALGGNIANKTYEVSYIPKMFLLDKTGKIVGKDLRGEALEDAIKKLFP